MKYKGDLGILSLMDLARRIPLELAPKGIKTTLSFNLVFKCTNNQAEYEALVIDLKILLELGA